MADFNGPVSNPPQERSRVWYDADLPELSPGTRDVLENYSKIPADEINAHIRDIRDKAWAVHNYPCIGMWRFLELSIGLHKLYPEVLERMKTGQQTYLELGCAFGQDIRRLVADGVDSSKCYASDLQLDFINLGYELFRDKESLKTKFITANVFDAESPLKELEGSVDIIGASSFFHLFSWDEQKHVGLRVAQLLKPQSNVLLLGRQVGNENPGDIPRRAGSGSRYRHNAETWQKLWDEIGKEVGAQFRTECGLQPLKVSYHEPGTIMMEFSVRRV